LKWADAFRLLAGLPASSVNLEWAQEELESTASR
jgi:hypothetical protein